MTPNTLLKLSGRVTPVGWHLPAKMTFDEWCRAGEMLGRIERSVAWWIGDWWVYGEHRYGERKAIVEAEGWAGPSFQTCANCGSVAKAFETSCRQEVLSFEHHRLVAALDPVDAKRLLDMAVAGGWSSRELRVAVSRSRSNGNGLLGQPGRVEDLFEAARQGRRWSTIYADPPWAYDNQGTRAATDRHYPTMTVEALCDLPIDQLVNDDAHLHLWTTNAFLFECPQIFAAWGFEFKSSFVWVKSEMGIGNYWRNAHEFLLTGVRGDAKRFNDHDLISWHECSRGKHSSKPDRVRDFIERASPAPRLELFARRATAGWNFWGDEVETDLFSEPDAA